MHCQSTYGDGSGSSISAVRTERTAHPGPLGRVSARQGDLEPVSGFEPLTVRLQGHRAKRCADLRKRKSLTSETALGGRCVFDANRVRCALSTSAFTRPCSGPMTTSTMSVKLTPSSAWSLDENTGRSPLLPIPPGINMRFVDSHRRRMQSRQARCCRERSGSSNTPCVVADRSGG